MIFRSREDAGRRLATLLTPYANRDEVVVLGIPRGGVSVACEVSRALHARLEVFLSSKLGVPGHEELAFGAVAAGDGRFLDDEIVRSAGISDEQIESITKAAVSKLQDRAILYRGNRPPLALQEKVVILVDDGIATGASIYASIHALREMKPAKLIVAVPVAPRSTCNWLRPLVDELVCLHIPKVFFAVGQFYERFDQVTDEEVVDLLVRAERPTEIHAREE